MSDNAITRIPFKVRETFTLEKFDGEITPGKTPVEIITFTGREYIVERPLPKEEDNGHSADG